MTFALYAVYVSLLFVFFVLLSLLKTQKTKTQVLLNTIFLCGYKTVWVILSVHPYLLSLGAAFALFTNLCKIILK